MTTKKPAAGDFVQAYCMNCKEETKNIVIALTKETPSKVQCTICKGTHNYLKQSKTKDKSQKMKIALNKTQIQEWQDIVSGLDAKRAIPYGIGDVYKKGDLLLHKQFGIGLVRGAPCYKRMKVLFQDGEKSMLCGN